MLDSLALPPRDTDQGHRAATQLELLFDLVSVIAIASAAVGLHHGIAHAHYAEAILKFSFAFFSICWAWMNYSWFASAYDNGSAFFKINTLVIMFGSLVFAAGLPRFFETNDLTLGYIGYGIMRFGMVIFWLLAAQGHPERRKTALQYAIGISAAQVYWVLVIVFAHELGAIYGGLLFLGLLIELSIPYFAEADQRTPWHREHIIERYGLLNIIVLGELLLAASLAIGQTADLDHFNPAFLTVGASAFIVCCCMWWIYFIDIEVLDTDVKTRTFTWGYGHFLIFGSGAAVGAGFAVLVDVIAHKAHTTMHVGVMAVGLPLALYLLAVWLTRDRFRRSGAHGLVLPVAAAVVAALSLLGGNLVLITGAIVVTTIAHHLTHREAAQG